jgi:hypothetical protein
MATATCDRCGKTMTVSTPMKVLLVSGKKTVPHSCGGKFK